MRSFLFGCVAAPLVCTAESHAQSVGELAPIVVTATRIAQSSAELPASVDRVEARTIQEGQLQVNLSESLLTVPGVSAQNRQNYAQDLQISVRGFGARSSFGVRGVRLYSDGIPGTMPDGQGQFSQFDLSSAGRIEVLRGPFSALYGNSSGGVIAVFTEDAPPGVSIGGGAEYGTFNTQRYDLKATSGGEAANAVIDASHFQTDGYRYHSDAERNLFNIKVTYQLDARSLLTLVGNAVQSPFDQDPLGLTRAQVASNRRQAGIGALAYDARKNLGQSQGGAVYDNKLSDTDELSGTLYAGHRRTTQFQAIPQATQAAAPLYPGGVIDLSRNYWGIDLHATDHREIARTPLQITLGVAYDDLEEARRGFLNYSGMDLGVEGALRRNEANHVYDADQYLQAQWDINPLWRLTAGVRNSAVHITSHDHFDDLAAPDTGVQYSSTNPVVGVTLRAASFANVYAAYGKGFETPTLNDLAYRSTDGSLPGLNLGLRPARSDNFEVGIKAGTSWLRADLAGFYTKTEDELAVLANSSGRTVDQNIGETTRHGAELEVDADLQDGFSVQLAYTYIRAIVAQPYYTCVGTPCKQPTPGGPQPANYLLVPAGRHLPAVPQNSLYTGLTWRSSALGFFATVEAQGRARIYTDDRNSDFASGYWVANLRAGFEQQTNNWRFGESASIDNIVNRNYIATVIVNESNSRFFESSPGRTAYIMLNAAWR